MPTAAIIAHWLDGWGTPTPLGGPGVVLVFVETNALVFEEVDALVFLEKGGEPVIDTPDDPPGEDPHVLTYREGSR